MQADEATRAASALRSQLRRALLDKKGTIRQWCRSDGSVWLEDFHGAVTALGVKAHPVITGALFRTISEGSSKISVRNLERMLLKNTR